MRAIAKGLGMIATGAGVVGGITLVGLMLTTVFDVTLRSTLNVAFLGVTEITELGLVIVAIFGIAYCGWTDGHVALEFGEQVMPAAAWRVVQRTTLLISSAVIAVAAYYCFVEAAAVHQRGAHTNLLQISEFPFYALVGLGFLLYAAVLLFNAVAHRRAGGNAGPGS